MKNIKFSFFVAVISVVAFLSSCQKDSITVSLKTSGTLSVQLADTAGNKFQKVKVHLYSYIVSDGMQITYAGEIDSKLSDSNGSVSFGILEAGNYYVVTDTIKNGKKKYLIAKAVQVISADTKNLIINPFDYVGTIKLHIYIETNGAIDTINRKNLKVALVNYNDYNSLDNRQKVINKAVDIKSSDANGNVEFDKIPSDIDYMAYVYINNTDTMGGWASGSFMVSKDDIYSGEADIYLTNLFIIKANVTLSIQYYSFSSGYDKPVTAANVVLIKYVDYNNYSLNYASQSTILSHKVVSGTTNTNGMVLFTNVPANIEYYAYVYYSISNYTWITSYMYPYPNYTNSYNFYITGSDLGLTK